jgi:hypothetical protein
MHATTVESLEAELRGFRTSQASRSVQKISAGISLVILALGFSLIGLLSLTRGPLAGDSLAFSAISRVIGGWAGLGAGSIFFGVAFVYWRPLLRKDHILQMFQCFAAALSFWASSTALRAVKTTGFKNEIEATEAR